MYACVFSFSCRVNSILNNSQYLVRDEVILRLAPISNDRIAPLLCRSFPPFFFFTHRSVTLEFPDICIRYCFFFYRQNIDTRNVAGAQTSFAVR